MPAIEKEREVAVAELKEALAARAEFIAIAAHELRIPLNILTLMWRILFSDGRPHFCSRISHRRNSRCWATWLTL